MDDVLNDALSNLEHDNYERSHKGYENRQADIALIRAALAAQPAASDQDRQDMETGRKWREDSSLEAWFPLTAEELESTKRMFHAAISDLAAISERLGVDPDDGGAEPILSAIDDLAQPAASAEPSDEEAAKFADQYGMYYDQDTSIAGAHARALLSRYGSPAGDAQPVADHKFYPHPGYRAFCQKCGKAEADHPTAPVAAQKADGWGAKYRMLARGDVIQRGDEFLDDDCVSWNGIAEWERGMQYDPAIFKAGRRRIDAAIAQQRKGE